MGISKLDATSPGIINDPCNRRVTQRNWQEVKSKLADIINKVNEQTDILNLNQIQNINVTINTIINSTAFQNSVNSYISSYLINYFASLNANVISFTLDAELTLAAMWQASATVNNSFDGAAPGGTVTVLDPAARWRWTAFQGAKGVAIQKDDAAAEYIIMDVECLAPIVRFRAAADWTTADQAVECNVVSKRFIDRGDPSTSFGSTLWVGNPPDNGGNYRFEGVASNYLEAALVYSDAKPADTAGDPAYVMFQTECS
jgi:hypothetical protein